MYKGHKGHKLSQMTVSHVFWITEFKNCNDKMFLSRRSGDNRGWFSTFFLPIMIYVPKYTGNIYLSNHRSNFGFLRFSKSVSRNTSRKVIIPIAFFYSIRFFESLGLSGPPLYGDVKILYKPPAPPPVAR